MATDTDTDAGTQPGTGEGTGDDAPAPTQQDALAVIEAGIAEADGTEPPKRDTDTRGDEGAADAAPGSGDGPPGEGAGASADDGTAGEGAGGEGEGTGDGGAGTAAAAGAEAGKTGEGEGEGDADDTGKTGLEHVDEPIPADTPKRTAERMEKLIGTVKEVSAERDQLSEQTNQMAELIRGTGATPEEFGQTMEFLGNLKSEDPAKRQKALEYAQQQHASLARELGAEVPGDDPLERHTDLKEEVELGDIKRERALEIARQRDRDAAQKERSDQQQRTQAEQQEYEQKVSRARQDLNALEDELRRAEPQLYDAKRPQLLASIRAITQNVDPAKWVDTAREVYRNLEAPAGGGAAPGTGNGTGEAADAGGEAGTHQSEADRRRQPRRPSQPAGGKKREVGSMMEAIDAGIEQAGGG